MARMARCTDGFTLVDFLTSLAIVGVLAGIALPSIRAARGAGYAADTEARLVGSISDAVRQAVVVGRPVVMCPSRNAVTCADSLDWNGGWIVFTDEDGNRSRSPAETIHRSEPALDANLALVTSTGRRHVRFQPSGSVEGTNLTFTLCDPRGDTSAVAWVMGNSGRLRRRAAAPGASQRCAREVARA